MLNIKFFFSHKEEWINHTKIICKRRNWKLFEEKGKILYQKRENYKYRTTTPNLAVHQANRIPYYMRQLQDCYRGRDGREDEGFGWGVTTPRTVWNPSRVAHYPELQLWTRRRPFLWDFLLKFRLKFQSWANQKLFCFSSSELGKIFFVHLLKELRSSSQLCFDGRSAQKKHKYMIIKNLLRNRCINKL